MLDFPASRTAGNKIPIIYKLKKTYFNSLHPLHHPSPAFFPHSL
jgi:hypothetical protein